ncbi:flippase-like domain-containing protein [Lichenibacterium dinghuense]|uniref:flippase-like domain-containing protein n=1 Tax=Lichenibacterium dinghuense TaxID=2895977 RepID=UPI001F1B7B81|nr:flippase-like domain-containing protein [Lichenibacterium sp. 6Y81]
MRLTFVIASAVGVAAAVALVAFYGWQPILEAVRAVGWGVLPVSLVRAGEAAGAAVCWWLLLDRQNSETLRATLLLRWVRESVNALLPVAQVGGEVVGARLLTFWGVPKSLAAASVLVDLLAQTATQFVFTLIGLALLAGVEGGGPIVRWVGLGLAMLGPALAGFFAAQRFGGARLLDRALRHFTDDPQWAAVGGGLEALNERLLRIYRRRWRLAAVFALHFAIWFFGTLEVWTALHFMGQPVHYSTALVIESLGQAVRGAAFVVPGGIGVQEAGFVALCALFGIPAPDAIALSLAKRFPEVVLGLPGLGVWQWLESHRALKGGASLGAHRPSEPSAPAPRRL